MYPHLRYPVLIWRVLATVLNAALSGSYIIQSQAKVAGPFQYFNATCRKWCSKKSKIAKDMRVATSKADRVVDVAEAEKDHIQLYYRFWVTCVIQARGTLKANWRSITFRLRTTSTSSSTWIFRSRFVKPAGWLAFTDIHRPTLVLIRPFLTGDYPG
jgi:hypothetical protein